MKDKVRISLSRTTLNFMQNSLIGQIDRTKQAILDLSKLEGDHSGDIRYQARRLVGLEAAEMELSEQMKRFN